VKWDPNLYARYADERGRPFIELAGRVRAEKPRRVVDLGCGPGNLTALLAARWPDAIVEGVDSSAEMITAANRVATGNLTFRIDDIAGWHVPADADVVVSNAALQWVPGHRDLVRRWAAELPTDGWLGFQVPSNFHAPSHALMRALAESPRWEPLVGHVLRHHDSVASLDVYATLLLEAGLSADVWETNYVHVLPGEDPVLEWVRGTGLRPILAALSPADAAEFEAEYRAELRIAYPAHEYGTLFPFQRIFAVGHRS
jgi:trans-aconitate 2-methyltransferase